DSVIEGVPEVVFGGPGGRDLYPDRRLLDPIPEAGWRAPVRHQRQPISLSDQAGPLRHGEAPLGASRPREPPAAPYLGRLPSRESRSRRGAKRGAESGSAPAPASRA